MKTFEEILSYHTGYTVDELADRATSPILQPYDVLLSHKEWEHQVKKLNIPAVVGQSEQLVCPDCAEGRDEFAPEWECPKCRDKDYAN
jgi:hypothetical protein